ncbi:hypothetical protein N657DRAFT_264331 [Parathielavia appendiculata]|uniref:Uncharacterized protein n=1 Tax=Parathielavia appendiculata TaxID=2587402 RepID=A0AAN6Z540_9PEZI|nr:hypothetical protein N657DRAFT_264331 [Parathielavia appendiculata]
MRDAMMSSAITGRLRLMSGFSWLPSSPCSLATRLLPLQWGQAGPSISTGCHVSGANFRGQIHAGSNSQFLCLPC